ncbi:putative tiptop [Schistosoma mansoni]|uniref:putative tiptop n=1 Tax=Schistosoma mansoni TaxID=6183 RepID=UPI00019B3850|nr:putative tiptop [Schistosoma mansoni]|eukprot:XP_018654017.1 putative tiptop [Schistosoma mansoni]
MPCVGILTPIIMDTSSSSTNQINTCRSTDFTLPEINSPSTHTLQNSDYMGSGHRKSSNNNIDINNSNKAQNRSPDLSHLSYTMVSTPQPPPLDLSNMPNSPSKSQTIDFLEVSSGKMQNSPKTTGSLETNTTSSIVTVTVATTVSSTSDINHDKSINSKSNMKCEVNSTPQDLIPIVPTIEKLVNVNWIEALKQYTEQHTTTKTNTNESNLDNEIDLTKTSEHNNNNKLNNEQINFNSQTSSPDLTAHFQAILTNLSEFLFNSSQLTNFSKNPMISNLSYSTPSSATTTSVPSSNSSTSQINSDNLKFDSRNQQSTSLSNSMYPQNFIEHQTGYNMFSAADLSSTNPSLAITASLLSLLVGGQKPSPFLEQSLPQPSTYSKCPISSPKSYQTPDLYPQQFLGNTSIVPLPQPSPSSSQVSPSKFSKSSVTLQHMPLQSSLSPHRSLAPASCPLVDLPNLNESKSSDPRDLLYQLGQQLMAMATSGINGTRPNLDLWNMSNTDSNCNSLNLTSLSNRSNPAHIQPHINSNAGHIPEQSFHHIPPPLQQHHPNTNTGPFSGISMRGNQKYSAYYQHQRKQGFQTGGMNEYVNNTVGRRQRNSLSPLSTNTRYVGRRLRGGLNNALLAGTNLEMRNSQRFPAIRNQTASIGNTANTINSGGNNTGNTVSSSGNLCPNFRGNTSYRMMSNIGNIASSHVLNPIKSHLQTENMNNTTHGHISSNNSSNNNSSQQTTRHRETAFICSCGKDFESLYIFTLHMKDTGHKPKCDQAEKDIPKLVRGQDMWINSETEQTREILRCMRCHQSFRSLPELTMHMMKTNHYSEIVYNDSGRCVFVNPDDNRRGSNSTASSSHYSGNSNPSHTSGKSGLSVMGTFGGRRSHRNMNMNWLSNTQTNNSNARISSNEELNSVMKQNIKQHTLTCDKYDTDNSGEISKRFGHLDDDKNVIKSNQHSTSKGYCEEEKNEDEEIQVDAQNNINSLSSPTSSQLGISLSPSSTLCKTEEENQQSAKSSLVYDDTLDKISRKQDTELIESENNNNVLQKIESFVEISVNNNNLSTKDEFSNQNFIQSTSPESVNSAVERNSPTIRLSPKLHRKRTYSEAGISINSVLDIPTNNTTTSVDTVSYTPTSSPVTTSRNELNYDEKLDFDMTVDAKQVIPSTSNSSNTSSKVSSTSEMNKNFSESPLSSLQKLVDTTHKPIKSSSLTSTTSVHSQYSPNKSGMNTCPNSPYSVHSTISSGKLQTSPLSSPIAESDNLIPALSALYAYVERSSSSTQFRDNQYNLSFNNPDKLSDMNSSVSSPPLLNHLSTSTISSNTPNYPCHNDNPTLLSSQSSPQHSAVMSQMLPTFPIPTHPLIQAIYDAAMSNLAGQYLNPQISTCSSNTPMNDPLNTFKYAVMNFKEALDSFEVSSTNMQSNVIQTPPSSSTTTSMLPSVGDNSGNDGQAMDLANNWLNMLRSLVESTEKFDGFNSGCCKSNNSYSESSSSNMSTAPDRFGNHRLADFTLHSSNPKSLSTTSIHDQSTSNIQHKILPSLQNDSMHLNYSVAMNRNRSNYSYNSTLPSSSSPISTTVMNTPNMLAVNRLTNIPSSFHSCPCLLQQSCHVAALTAAFGSNTNNNTNTLTSNNSSVRKMPQSVGTVKSNPVNTYLSSTVSKRNNNITSGNTVVATNNNSNVSQTFTDSIHQCTSNSLGSNSKDDLISAPSALSLLKERFQNYDVNQNSTNYPNFSSYLPTNVSNSLEPKLTPTSSTITSSLSSSNNVFPHSTKTSTASMPISSSMSDMSWLGGLNCTASFPTSQLNKDAEFMNTSIPGTASTAAAVNAGHLAAMALLAQTLVQLKNATQSPSTSNTPLSQLMDSVNSSVSKTNITSPKPNSSENLSEQNNPLLPLLASNLLNLKNSNQTLQSGMPFNFNLETLFNQMNMAKQLNSFNWPLNSQAVNIDDNQSYRQPQQSQQQQPQD